MDEWNEEDPIDPGKYRTLHSAGIENENGVEKTYTALTYWDGKTWVDLSYQWWPIGWVYISEEEND